MRAGELSPAAAAFDAVARDFDRRYGPWLSVAAQRRAVRALLAEAFPAGTRLIEIGGGTGDDALWLLEHGRKVLLTDASPAMVRLAAAKLADRRGGRAEVVPAEYLEPFAARRSAEGLPRFDGAYSNFAALNCTADLRPVARGLAHLVRPSAPVMLVLFGTCSPGEMLVEGLRGRFANMARRRGRGDVPARLGGRTFAVRYHRPRYIVRAMAPWFVLKRRLAIGLLVPPSAAEPWISRHPRLLTWLEKADRILSAPLAPFGDHVLYHFERTEAAAP